MSISGLFCVMDGRHALDFTSHFEVLPELFPGDARREVSDLY